MDARALSFHLSIISLCVCLSVFLIFSSILWILALLKLQAYKQASFGVSSGPPLKSVKKSRITMTVNIDVLALNRMEKSKWHMEIDVMCAKE